MRSTSAAPRRARRYFFFFYLVILTNIEKKKLKINFDLKKKLSNSNQTNSTFVDQNQKKNLFKKKKSDKLHNSLLRFRQHQQQLKKKL
ncbi:hypothetical protein BpHYR1_014182 [Brachionus plicatilis]|uniref:Uncharacterized protein n=1 Tax=Brachionus plicatilis TaxID=10195 RepID=A0A3M7SFT2_BRAPC|nr:hypothetical protein BpHYR1_014182 [Brachionus plicatilis]